MFGVLSISKILPKACSSVDRASVGGAEDLGFDSY